MRLNSILNRLDFHCRAEFGKKEPYLFEENCIHHWVSLVEKIAVLDKCANYFAYLLTCFNLLQLVIVLLNVIHGKFSLKLFLFGKTLIFLGQLL